MTVSGTSFVRQNTINSLRLNEDSKTFNVEPDVNSASNESFTYKNSNPAEIFPYLKKNKIQVEPKARADINHSIHSYSNMPKETQISSSIEIKRDKIRDVKISKFFEGMTM